MVQVTGGRWKSVIISLLVVAALAYGWLRLRPTNPDGPERANLIQEQRGLFDALPDRGGREVSRTPLAPDAPDAAPLLVAAPPSEGATVRAYALKYDDQGTGIAVLFKRPLRTETEDSEEVLRELRTALGIAAPQPGEHRVVKANAFGYVTPWRQGKLVVTGQVDRLPVAGRPRAWGVSLEWRKAP